MPNLTIQAGLRWEAQVEPIRSRRPTRSSSPASSARRSTDRPSPRTETSRPTGICGSLVWGSPTTVEGRQDRLSGNIGLFYAGSPGSPWPRPARPTAASARRSTAVSSRETLSTPYATDSGLRDRHPRPSGRLRHLQRLQNPRTMAWSASVEKEVLPSWAVLLKYNYAKTTHLTRFVNRNAAELGSPWSTGLDPRPRRRGRHQRRRAVDHGRVQRAEQVLGLDPRRDKAFFGPRRIPGQLHVLQGQVGRRQRAGPIHPPVRGGSTRTLPTRRRSSRRSGAIPTGTSGIASTPT